MYLVNLIGKIAIILILLKIKKIRQKLIKDYNALSKFIDNNYDKIKNERTYFLTFIIIQRFYIHSFNDNVKFPKPKDILKKVDSILSIFPDKDIYSMYEKGVNLELHLVCTLSDLQNY